MFRRSSSFLLASLFVMSCAEEADSDVAKSSTDDGESGNAEASANANDDEGNEENGEEGGTAGGGSQQQEDGSNDDGNEGSNDVDPEERGEAARGLSIDRIEVNSGTGIPIVKDGEWLELKDRNAPIPKNRNTLFRVFLDVDDDNWVARKIRGVLTLSYDDGTKKHIEANITLEGDSDTFDLGSTFLFGALAEDIRPDAKVTVRTFEVEDESSKWEDLAEDTKGSVFPEDGVAKRVGIEADELELKVVLVPVDYEGPSCSRKTDISDEYIQGYVDSLYQRNPVSKIDLQIHDYYKVDDLNLADSNDFFIFLQRMALLRATENPEPNVYYYGLFDNCGHCISQGAQGPGAPTAGCVLGVATGTPGPDQGGAPFRVAIGQTDMGGNETGIGTFVHEIGHTQGRPHVECPNAESAGPDDNYPHEDGHLGTWGFNIMSSQFYDPESHYDYMSYCAPAWVSDYVWLLTFLQIRALTSWDYEEGNSVPSDERMLMGAVNPQSGESNWWTVAGNFSPTSEIHELHTFTFVAENGEESSQSAEVQAWSEGPWFSVRTPLPENFDGNIKQVRYDAPHLAAEQNIQQVILTDQNQKLWKASSIRSKNN